MIMVQQAGRGEILIYQTKDGKAVLDVKLENETVWLTQSQLCDLFERDKSVISRHIRNIFEEGGNCIANRLLQKKQQSFIVVSGEM